VTGPDLRAYGRPGAHHRPASSRPRRLHLTEQAAAIGRPAQSRIESRNTHEVLPVPLDRNPCIRRYLTRFTNSLERLDQLRVHTRHRRIDDECLLSPQPRNDLLQHLQPCLRHAWERPQFIRPLRAATHAVLPEGPVDLPGVTHRT